MSVYVERYPGQHLKVHQVCRTAFECGRPWLTFDKIQDFSGTWPVAGAVMALRDQDKLQTRIGPTGRVEIAVREAGR